MTSTQLFSARGTIRRSALVLIGAATLAACNTDAPLAPATTSNAAAPAGGNKAAFGKATARVKWTAMGPYSPVGGATFKWNYTNGSQLVVDDAALDLDKTPGRFEIEVSPLLGFGICTATPPAHWVFIAETCIGFPTQPGQTYDLGMISLYPDFSAYWETSDYQGLVGPAAYVVRSKSIRFMTTVVDNGAGDINPELGRVWAHFPAEGSYEICQTKAAPGTMLANPACKTVDVKLGQPVHVGIFLNKPI